jgi:hypothetical protein
MSTLRARLGPHKGLNADWSVEAWELGKGLWIINAEDGTFALVHRTATDYGLFDVTELGTVIPEGEE